VASILSVSHLCKSFGSFKAVDDLSFEVFPGDIYGFLGQNGAGKSTTMRMMLGLIRPDYGTISIRNEPFHPGNRNLLRHIGAIIERPDLYNYLSGLDNLRIFARLSQIPINNRDLDKLLELVSLKGREHDKVGAYSQGMKQRLGIAVALVHNPDILLLDEPTNGLDPQGIADIRSLIIHLSQDQGKTIIISSHLLHEVEQMATRMLIIHEGKKIVEGPVRELLDPSGTLIDIAYTSDSDLTGTIRAQAQWSGLLKEASKQRLVFEMDPALAPELNRWLVQQGANIYSMEARHSLESYFLSLTHDSPAAN